MIFTELTDAAFQNMQAAADAYAAGSAYRTPCCRADAYDDTAIGHDGCPVGPTVTRCDNCDKDVTEDYAKIF
jgi:hypothetical protein